MPFYEFFVGIFGILTLLEARESRIASGTLEAAALHVPSSELHAPSY